MGGGLTGGYDASLLECAEDCEARDDCGSFSHSATKDHCKLMAESFPAETSNFEDYQFCRKEDYN